MKRVWSARPVSIVWLNYMEQWVRTCARTSVDSPHLRLAVISVIVHALQVV